MDKEESVVAVEAQAEEQILNTAALVETPEVQPAELPSHGDAFVPESTVEEVTGTGTREDETPAPQAESPVSFPTSESPTHIAFPTAESTEAFPALDHASSPVAFPSSDSTAPVAFPASDASLENTPSLAAQSPGVTFSDAPSPARSGTPDVDSDGKRRRTLSTQGIQRLARRLSVSGRQGSVSPSLPAAIFQSLKRGDSGKRDSKESAREDGSLPTPESDSMKDAAPIAKDSPEASPVGEASKAKSTKKKDKKKEKKRRTTQA